MITIASVYSVTSSINPKDNIQGYVIRYGNSTIGYQLTKEELLKQWKGFVLNSKYVRPGDIELLYNGKLIRSIINMQNRILDKTAKYPCKHYKYA